MKLLITQLLLALLPFTLFSQAPTNPADFVIGGTLSSRDKMPEWGGKDFRRVFTHEAYGGRLGIIGDEFRRIKVRFISVIQDADEPTLYYVYGKTSVMGNVCDFQGNIRIIEIKEVTVDEEMSEIPNAQHGLLVCSYTFFENPQQSHVGIFRGKVFSQFLLDELGIPHYDDSGSGMDGYFNNQFVGTWSEYGKKTGRLCNWGDYRIPQSGDLDMGAAEFAPAEKYHKVGWSSYSKAQLGDEKAKMEENKTWWE